jgi:hypothetical protein
MHDAKIGQTAMGAEPRQVVNLIGSAATKQVRGCRTCWRRLPQHIDRLRRKYIQ